jgi:hypothetical protein
MLEKAIFYLELYMKSFVIPLLIWSLICLALREYVEDFKASTITDDILLYAKDVKIYFCQY